MSSEESVKLFVPKPFAMSPFLQTVELRPDSASSSPTPAAEGRRRRVLPGLVARHDPLLVRRVRLAPAHIDADPRARRRRTLHP
jgi:hypothetical protein